MKAKLIYVLIAALAFLGGLNIFQSLKEKFHPEEAIVVEYEAGLDGAVKHTIHLKRSFYEDAAPNAEVVIDRRFKVRPGERLAVDVPHTDVIITAGENDEAHIRLTLDGRDLPRAREVYEAMNFRVEQRDGTVSVTAESPDGGWSWNKMGGLDLLLEIRIPERFDVEVATSHGDLKLASFEGEINARTSHGDLEARALTGPLVRLKTSHGDLEAGVLVGEEVLVRTSHGDIDLGEVSAATFEAHTSHADVEIGRLESRTRITNSHGDITFFLAKPAEASLKTSHGDIFLTVPESFGADLDLKGGRVRLNGTDFSGDYNREDRAEGRLNGGGPLIQARTSHGSIVVRHR